MCVFAIFWFYLLMVVGTCVAMTHNCYLHDTLFSICTAIFYLYIPFYLYIFYSFCIWLKD